MVGGKEADITMMTYYCISPQGLTLVTWYASWHTTIGEGVTSAVRGRRKGGKPLSRANLAKLPWQSLMLWSHYLSLYNVY